MTTAVAIAPVRHGPADAAERSLGWAAMKWAATWLEQPDRNIAGKPWAFTREQMRFVANWYAIDEQGEFRYTYGVLRRMKGHGKDPLMAVLAAIEFVGPCRFGGWLANGEPKVIPQPSAWVQVAATAQSQTRNTMLFFPSLFSKRAIAQYNINLGKEIIYAEGGRRQIQAVTSSAKVIEGGRSTFVIQGETQHWLENNEGHEMAAAIRRNSAKVGGRGLAITNAHRIGEGSVAEEDWEKYLRDGDAGEMLYDSLEAPDVLGPDGSAKLLDDYTDDELREAITIARGDSVWVPVERIMIEARDVRDSETYRRRFYLNQIRQETSTWITAAAWANAERHEAVPPGTLITLGFDGARFQDSTALVATTVKTGYQWVVALWKRPELAKEWEIPENEVNDAVHAVFEQYKVWRMYCDPYWWEETISRWAGEFGDDKVVFFHTNRQIARMTRALKAYETAIRTGEIGHAADKEFAEQIANAVKRLVNMRDEDGERLYLIGKEHKGSPRKMDIAMSAVLSAAARSDALAGGALADDGEWTWGAV